MIKSFKDASNLIKQFRWSSLLTKYFKTFFLVLILPISILNICVYSYSNSSSNKEISVFVKQSSQIVANSLNITLNSFYNNYLLYLDDVNVQKYLSSQPSDVSSVDFYSIIAEIREKMDLHILSSSYLESIYLYSFENNYVLSDTHGNPTEFFYDTNFLDYYKTHKKSFFIAPQKTTHDTYVSVCYELTNTNIPNGLVVFNFDLQRFQESLFSDTNTPFISVSLFNEMNERVFVIGEKFSNDIFEKSSNSSEIQIKNTDEYLHTLIPLGHSNFTLQVSFISEHLSLQKSKAILYLLLGFVLCFIAATTLSIYLSFKFYESISGIIMQMNEEKIANIPQSNKAARKFDELSFISQNITKLTLNYSLIEDELYKNIAKLKQMQIMTLQAQLNPHFLFNTLNHISILTLDAGEKGELANSIICNLSALLRISLENKQYVVDAKTEIYYVKKYIEIERIKHKNKFDVSWDIDEEINNCTVVKFMLQPIVENAFIHGIYKAQNKENGLLSISAHIVNKNVVFKIKDNGPGIDEDKLNLLISNLKTNDLPDTKHIGVLNVHQRIKLIFGEEYGITNITSDSEGTTIELTLPNEPYNR